MGRRWLVLLALPHFVTAALLPGHIAATRARIEDCAHRSAPDAVGLAEMGPACPDIGEAVDDLGLDGLLPSDWRSHVTPRELADLSVLAQRYAASPPSPLPSAQRLQILARALQPPAEAASWWERFDEWLGRWLKANLGTWVERLNPRWKLSEGFWRSLGYVLAGGIVVAAAAFVAIELRAARGAGLRRRGRLAEQAFPAATGGTSTAPDLAAIDAAPPRLRAILMLRLLVNALDRSRRLERERNLTCRELITAATFDSAAQREQFRRLALLAEQALYDAPGAPHSLNAASTSSAAQDLHAARTLYEALLVTPRPVQPARP